jgi:uncharacterized membrane-anchored protein
MSEAFSQDLAAPSPGSSAMMGFASPLWGYYAGAALGGVAFWWMARWAQSSNLEALFADAQIPTFSPAAVIEPVVEAMADAEAPFVPAAEVLTSEPSAVVEAAPEMQPEPVAAPAANDAGAEDVKTALAPPIPRG